MNIWKVSLATVVFAGILISCGTPTIPTSTQTLVPATASFIPTTKNPTNTSTPTPETAPPTRTSMPEAIMPDTISPGTPTLGAAICPGGGGQAQAIIFNDQISKRAELARSFETQIVDFLNTTSDPDELARALINIDAPDFEEEMNLLSKVFAEDVTGDQTPEIVLDLIMYQNMDGVSTMADGFVYVFTCSEGQYQMVFSGDTCCHFLPENEGNEGIRDIIDMTQDGISEIVLTHIGNIGNHWNHYRSFQILSWDGEQFVNLIPETEFTYGISPYVAEVFNGDGVIEDTNGDGFLELVLTNDVEHYYVDGGPQRVRTDTWAWNGTAFTLNRWQHTPPEYRIHAVWDGDAASSKIGVGCGTWQ